MGNWTINKAQVTRFEYFTAVLLRLVFWVIPWKSRRKPTHWHFITSQNTKPSTLRHIPEHWPIDTPSHPRTLTHRHCITSHKTYPSMQRHIPEHWPIDTASHPVDRNPKHISRVCFCSMSYSLAGNIRCFIAIIKGNVEGNEHFSHSRFRRVAECPGFSPILYKL
jgi:hypothetical protein